MTDTKNHVENVCKPGTKDCCAYLVMGDGWECAKLTPVKQVIDLRLAEGTMQATGDNCEGREEL